MVILVGYCLFYAMCFLPRRPQQVTIHTRHLCLDYLLMVESEVGRDDAPFQVWRKSLRVEAGAVGAPVRVSAQQSKLAGSWNLNRCKEVFKSAPTSSDAKVTGTTVNLFDNMH
jgi:hypothetical protein